MTVITDQAALDALCHELAAHSWMTIDTEFLRDKTYYPTLCLVQVAAPEGPAYAIDPLAKGIDLTPLFDLMANENVLKVFHAARQDLEIFVNMAGKVPHPVFDTQVAAMVAGHGDQIGYLNLVQDICGQRLDKGAQFTDWSRRPLTEKQITYALDDVIWLRDVYRSLSRELKERGRLDWVKEEMEFLTHLDTYSNPPEESWKRLKLRTDKPQAIAILMEVCKWREEEAQKRNVPRQRIIRDETILDLAVHAPRSAEELKHIRNLGSDVANGKLGAAIMAAIERAMAKPKNEIPRQDKKKPLPPSLAPMVEMMKLLLRIVSSENEVAGRLIASPEEIEDIARDDKADVPPMKGWRFEVFGKEVLDLKHGRVALAVKGGEIVRHKLG
ncbi:MAG: Ribonuclease [Micavibrio sp.]|nr:Ribonuclease [Micavibrio sp.]